MMVEWRSEILTLIALAGSWTIFHLWGKRFFWQMWFPGVLIGMAIEFMTEPAWTYSMRFFIWRDISPFVIAGWGILFTWLVTFSDYLYLKLFGARAGSRGPRDYRLILTDIIIGVPLFLGNELFGLQVLKVWKYNPVLNWSEMIPVIGYPLEGIIAIVFFVSAIPMAVRYWKGY